MNVSVTSVGRTTSTVDTEGRNVRDVEPDIQELEPSEAPLTQILTRLATETATNMKVEWFEDARLPEFDTLNLALAAGDANISVANPSFYIAGMVLKIADNELVRVTGPAVGNLVPILRGQGTAALAANNGARIYIVSLAQKEGDTISTSLSTQKVPKYNYCQKIETAVQWSDEDMGTEMWAGRDLLIEQDKMIVEHKVRTEKQLVHGVPYLDTTTGSKVWTMGGFLYYIQTNIKDVSAGFTEAEFEDFLRICFRYGGRHKLLFCSPKLIQSVNAFARGKLQTFSDEDSYGVTITEFRSAGRHIGLIENPLLTNSDLNDLTGQAGYGFLVDPQYMKLKYFEGKTTKLHENLQNPNAQYRQDAVRSSPGFVMPLDQAHGILTGVNA